MEAIAFQPNPSVLGRRQRFRPGERDRLARDRDNQAAPLRGALPHELFHSSSR